MEAGLAFDQCDQHHCPQERSSDELGDLTCRLKQVVAFDLKCLSPEVGEDLFAAFNDDVSSGILGDSKKSQS